MASKRDSARYLLRLLGRKRRPRTGCWVTHVLCQDCAKTPATVHLTEVVNGEQSRIWLCAPCVEARNPHFAPKIPNVPTEFGQIAGQSGIDDEASEASTSDASKLPKVDAICPSCGITWPEFQEQERLGCPRDYDVFEEPLAMILRKMHGADTHSGRQPAAVRERTLLRERLEALRRELDDAVRDEHYEVAARLRDRIRDLERVETAEVRD